MRALACHAARPRHAPRCLRKAGCLWTGTVPLGCSLRSASTLPAAAPRVRLSFVLGQSLATFARVQRCLELAVARVLWCSSAPCASLPAQSRMLVDGDCPSGLQPAQRRDAAGRGAGC